MITRAILSLLKHNNRVNVPTLGAIIKQQDFSQTLFFNQFIKYDDGLLSGHLTKIEMLTEEESQAAVLGFIEAIEEGIHQDGKFELKGLGILCCVDNRLELLTEKEYFRLLTLSKVHAPRETAQMGITDVNIESLSCNNPEKEDGILIADAECDDGDCELNDGISSPSPFPRHSVIALDGPEPREEALQTSTRFASSTKKIRYSSRPLKFIRVAIPLIVLGLSLVRLSLPIPGSHPTAAVVDSVELVPPDTTSRVPTSDGISKVVVVEKAQEDTGLVYHVIIGAFRFESNADKLVAEQLVRGHVVSKLGKRNGYYLVSYESTTDVWTAKKICKDLKAFYPEVWLDKQE